MSTSIDIYLLITAGKFDKKIEEMMIRRIGNIGVCGILKENTVDPKNNLLPADFTKVLFQMEIRATDEVYFVKGVDFDYTYASANDHGMQIDWCDYLKDNVPNVLRMGDYYRSFTLQNKFTYFVKNFLQYLEIHTYKRNPYSQNLCDIEDYEPLYPIYVKATSGSIDNLFFKIFDNKEIKILDDRAYEERKLYFRAMLAFKSPFDLEDQFKMEERKYYLNSRKLVFMDKIKRTKQSTRFKNMFIDKFNRNHNLIDPSNDPIYFKDLKLSKIEEDVIRNQDEIYSVFCSQVSKFVFIKNAHHKYLEILTAGISNKQKTMNWQMESVEALSDSYGSEDEKN